MIPRHQEARPCHGPRCQILRNKAALYTWMRHKGLHINSNVNINTRRSEKLLRWRCDWCLSNLEKRTYFKPSNGPRQTLNMCLFHCKVWCLLFVSSIHSCNRPVLTCYTLRGKHKCILYWHALVIWKPAASPKHMNGRESRRARSVIIWHCGIITRWSFNINF